MSSFCRPVFAAMATPCHPVSKTTSAESPSNRLIIVERESLRQKPRVPETRCGICARHDGICHRSKCRRGRCRSCERDLTHPQWPSRVNFQVLKNVCRCVRVCLRTHDWCYTMSMCKWQRNHWSSRTHAIAVPCKCASLPHKKSSSICVLSLSKRLMQSQSKCNDTWHVIFLCPPFNINGMSPYGKI